MNYKVICEILRFLALKSGKIIMDVYNSNNVEVLMKSDNSPVTIADKKADEVITKGLKNYFPEIPIITEDQVKSHIFNHSVFFIVDPLDGTKEFIEGRRDFTVKSPLRLINSLVPSKGSTMKKTDAFKS